MEQSYKDIQTSIKNKKYSPIYLLHGEEPYFIDELAKFFENNIIDEGLKAFNLTILYGKEAEVIKITDNALKYPIVSDYQVIILKEAADMKGIQDLVSYCERPNNTTIFVICHKYKKLDSRTLLFKAIQKNGVVFESKKFFDNQIPDWISEELKSKQLYINSVASALMSEYLGNDLSKISNEIDKLVINCPPETQINEQIIQQYIGISKEFNLFELQKALCTRNVKNTMKIVLNFASNLKKYPLIVLITNLYNLFSKLLILQQNTSLKNDKELALTIGLKSDYFLKDYRSALLYYNPNQVEEILQILLTYDLKSKGVENVNTSEEELMKEMILKILYI
ncbi:MAG: DNA polymerase III subunit delta [Saprospiraceae bacterium]|nr:DNA polymerase III subunit delta [Saprospiraceae bacterium]